MSKKLSAKIASWVGERPDEWILKEWIQDALIQEASIPNVPTLRDQIAMSALTGICATFKPEYILDIANGLIGGAIPAKTAYALADAMLKARGE